MAEDMKPKGWFSRRHETNAAHEAAKMFRQTRAFPRPKQTWNPETKEWEKEGN